MRSVTSGIVLTLSAYLMFALQDASVKWLVDDVAVVQILFVRSSVILAACFIVGRRRVVTRAATSPIIKVMAVRTALLLGAWASYFSAARDLSLAELTTFYYVSPVFVTALAIPLLKERVSAVRWSSVALGLLGVIVAVNPFEAGWQPSPAVGLALFAAMLWAVSTILLRKSAMGESTLVQMTVFSALLVIATGMIAIWYWKPMTIESATLMMMVGLFAAAGQWALFESFRRAPVSVLAPFDYSALIWAFLLGALIWGHVPRVQVFVGAALIAVASVAVLLWERGAIPRHSNDSIDT